MNRTFSALTKTIILVGALASFGAHAQDENTGPNSSITRWAEDTYQYLGDNGERERGIEKFCVNVHPDGTCTMIMWHDLYARNLQYSVILRMAEDFRPLQASARVSGLYAHRSIWQRNRERTRWNL